MAYATSKEFPCRDCGQAVAWCESNKGKRYLGARKDWEGTDIDRNASRTYWPQHQCTPDPTWRERHAQAEQQRIATATAEGQIVKGVTVEVIKGRKVAKGTTGIVFWVADRPDGYDTMKIGFVTDAGDKHFINIDNVTIKVQETAQ